MNYYCLIASLPELQPDAQKLPFSLGEFKSELENTLSPVDYARIKIYFSKWDNLNLLTLLGKSVAKTNKLSNLSDDAILDIIRAFREGEQQSGVLGSLPYFKRFIPVYLEEDGSEPTYVYKDRIFAMYFEYASNVQNKFIADWFRFNFNLTNSLTAIICKKYDLPADKYVLGNDEMSESLRKSHARDFGVAAEFPEIEDVLKISEMDDINEKERRMDMLRWQWIVDRGKFHYFDMERIWIYLVKLDILDRWTKLSSSNGEENFRKMVDKFENSFGFSNEFIM